MHDFTRRMLLRAVLIGMAAMPLAAVMAPPVQAQTAAALTAQDRADLQRIQQYLNGITTMRARFLQISSTEGRAAGTFYLSRPGRMRIQYDPPTPYLYVANGALLTFWDGRLRQRTDVPLGSTLADFFTRENIQLGGDVTVTGIRRDAGLIQVEVVQTSDPGAGRLTMMFTDNPLQLSRWRIVDAQGITTMVNLSSIAYGVSMESSLFSAPMPNEGLNGLNNN